MRTIAAFAALLVLTQATAATAADEPITGNVAVALAALVAEHSPTLTAEEKAAMTKLLDGQSGFAFPAKKKIAVQLDAVVCVAGNVDILFHACDLTFGKTKVSLTGRKAHELTATLGEAGVTDDGAAGKVYKGLSKLKCTIEPTAIFQNDGEGAACTFTQGVP